MRKIMMIVAAAGVLCTIGASAEALPVVGSSAVAPATLGKGAIQKTELVIVRRRVVRRRVCRTVVTANRRVTRCVTR